VDCAVFTGELVFSTESMITAGATTASRFISHSASSSATKAGQRGGGGAAAEGAAAGGQHGAEDTATAARCASSVMIGDRGLLNYSLPVPINVCSASTHAFA
jgi:hypothetical protein